MAREKENIKILLNTIVEGTVIEGTISSKEDIRVDGTVIGSINCEKRVVVGKGGVINGDIKSVNADYFGTVNGNSSISEQLTLKETSKVTGEVNTKRVSIELGAYYSGKFSMLEKE